MTPPTAGQKRSNEEEEEVADVIHPEDKYNIGKVLGQGAFGTGCACDGQDARRIAPTQ